MWRLHGRKVIVFNRGGLMDALGCNIADHRWSNARHEKSAEVIVAAGKRREGPNNKIPSEAERPERESER